MYIIFGEIIRAYNKGDLFMNDLRYPIGQFTYKRPITEEMIDTWIQEIEDLPNELTKAIKDLDQKQLDTPYRVGGWTVRPSSPSRC